MEALSSFIPAPVKAVYKTGVVVVKTGCAIARPVIELGKVIINNPVTRFGKNVFWTCVNCRAIKQTGAKKAEATKTEAQAPKAELLEEQTDISGRTIIITRIVHQRLVKHQGGLLPVTEAPAKVVTKIGELAEQISGSVQTTVDAIEIVFPGLIPGAPIVAAVAGMGSNGMGISNTLQMKQASKRHRCIRTVNKAIIIANICFTISAIWLEHPTHVKQMVGWTVGTATAIGAADAAYEYRKRTAEVLKIAYEAISEFTQTLIIGLEM